MEGGTVSEKGTHFILVTQDDQVSSSVVVLPVDPAIRNRDHENPEKDFYVNNNTRSSTGGPTRTK